MKDEDVVPKLLPLTVTDMNDLLKQARDKWVQVPCHKVLVDGTRLTSRDIQAIAWFQAVAQLIHSKAGGPLVDIYLDEPNSDPTSDD